MVKSEQTRELGEKWFRKLQAEVAAAPAENLEDFRAAINADAMGPAGREGVDDED